jgi:hypothetical protein
MIQLDSSMILFWTINDSTWMIDDLTWMVDDPALMIDEVNLDDR